MSKNKIPGNTCIYNLKFNIGHKRDLQFFTQSFMCGQTYLPKHKVVYFIVYKQAKVIHLMRNQDNLNCRPDTRQTGAIRACSANR